MSAPAYFDRTTREDAKHVLRRALESAPNRRDAPVTIPRWVAELLDRHKP